MEIKINLTLEDINIISAALNNDALAYKDASLDHITDKDCFADCIESYRQRMALKKRFDDLFKERMAMYRCERREMTLRKFLEEHETDYVCLDTPGWRKIEKGSYFLEVLDDYDLCEFPTSIEDGADDYDVWVHIN